MADLLIKRVGTGVAIASTTDPYSSFEVHRLDRERWRATPDTAGIYLLYGLLNGAPTAYVGMSTKSMRSRIQTHHVNAQKAWFGVLFAIPLPAGYCQTVEAELIRRATEAEVVALANGAKESRWLDPDDVHVLPALDVIVESLEVLLGSDIFTARDEPDAQAATFNDGGKRAWTLDEWCDEATRLTGPEYAQAVRDLAGEWLASGAAGRRVELGNGRTTTAVFLVTDVGPHSYWPLAIYPAKVEVPFQWLAYRPATESEGMRRDLMERLNAIQGIDLDEAKLAAKPSFPPDVITDPTTRAQVFAVIEWFSDEVQARSELSP